MAGPTPDYRARPHCRERFESGWSDNQIDQLARNDDLLDGFRSFEVAYHVLCLAGKGENLVLFSSLPDLDPVTDLAIHLNH